MPGLMFIQEPLLGGFLTLLADPFDG